LPIHHQSLTNANHRERTLEGNALAKKDAPKKDDDEAPEEGAEAGAPKKKLSGKALILFIVLPAILVLGAGGGAAYFLLSKPAGEQHAEADGGHAKDKAKAKGKHGGGGGSGKEDEEGGVTITEGDGVVFVGLPEMLVNIASPDGRPAYLKLRLTLEAPDAEAVAAIEPQLPRISDQFLGFLRELRTDDLSGSAGTYRLRLELLRRVNLVIAPTQINAVLIEEMLVQ
jgi:flagellar FliL protein